MTALQRGLRTVLLAGLVLPGVALACSPSPCVVGGPTVGEPAGPVQEKAACRGATAKFCNLRIYQVMVEAFVDGDPDHDYGDGYGTSHHRGDLRGIIESLDHVADLGMNAIWLTPVFDSHAGEPQHRLNGARVVDLKLDATGYFTRDYFSIDPRFGTLEDARELVREAHSRGIAVLFDAVFGHHKGDLMPSPTGKLPVDSTDPADYFGDPAGYPGRVVDYDAPETLAFYKEVAVYWIEEIGIDGWRLDQAYQVPLEAWREIRSAVEAASAARGGPGYMVAEIFSGADDIAAQAFGPADDPALISAFDFPLRWATVGVLAGEEDPAKSRRPASTLNEPWAYGAHSTPYPPGALPNFMLGNHDFVRFGDLLQRADIASPPDPEYWIRHQLGFLLQAAYSGPITRYYGEELGDELPGYADRVESGCASQGLCDDHVARTSGKVPGVTLARTDLSGPQASLLEQHRKLMALRAAHPALSHGTRQHLYSDDDLYVDLKTWGDQEILLILNTGEDRSAVALLNSLFQGPVRSAVDLLTDDTVPVQASGALELYQEPLSGRLLLLNAESSLAAPAISQGMADAWRQKGVDGQGVLMSVMPDLGLMSLAWFTFDLERSPVNTGAQLGGPGQRWLTAIGPYQGNLAELSLRVTTGGRFDQAAPEPETEADGTIHLRFKDCHTAQMDYRIESLDLSGTIELQRIVDDNAVLCEALGAD